MSGNAPAPPQLVYDILERVVSLAQDTALVPLCRVSPDMRFLAQQELYRVLNFEREGIERPLGCLATIAAAPRLGKYVRVLKANGNLRSYPNTAEPLNGVLVDALALMPHLRVLSIPHLDSLVAPHPDVLETIVGMQRLVDITIAWHPRLAPLLMRLRPLRYLEFDAGSGVNNHSNNTGLERLLDVSASTLEDLRLTGYGLAQYLLTRPTLTFPKCEELRLLFCDPLELNIAQAFPAVRRLEIFPSQVKPLELITSHDSFPLIDLATLGVDIEGYPSHERKGRFVPHLALFSAGEKITVEGVMSLLALLQPEKLLSVQLPYTARQTHVFLEEIFGACPNLHFVGATSTIHDLPRLFSVIDSGCPTTLKFISLRCPLSDPNSLDLVFSIIAPSLNTLRARCPELTVIEVRRAGFASTEHELQIRLEPWDRGELRWIKKTARMAQPHPGFAWRL
ncbi:hypothetical protein AURDEDRAFT_130268 [Auricularia subglabra TFB-10046 SS5]|nr:hypothetical protein AURDEDRAFT_130268 [Auricularia subglabra TFB-10046 SS5]